MIYNVSSLFDLHRERLVKYAYKMYLSQQTYYRVSALDTRLGGAEQRLTDDLSELASSVAHLYSSLTKPLLDCALVGIALISFSSKMGAKTTPGKINVLKEFEYSFNDILFIYCQFLIIHSTTDEPSISP